MTKFRKLPVVVDAVKWSGFNAGAIEQFTGSTCLHVQDNNYSSVGNPNLDSVKDAVLVIPTLEGDMYADAGDWIIKGVAGEFYPCKPDIFVKTYEPVDGQS